MWPPARTAGFTLAIHGFHWWTSLAPLLTTQTLELCSQTNPQKSQAIVKALSNKKGTNLPAPEGNVCSLVLLSDFGTSEAHVSKIFSLQPRGLEWCYSPKRAAEVITFPIRQLVIGRASLGAGTAEME